VLLCLLSNALLLFEFLLSDVTDHILYVNINFCFAAPTPTTSHSKRSSSGSVNYAALHSPQAADDWEDLEGDLSPAVVTQAKKKSKKQTLEEERERERERDREIDAELARQVAAAASSANGAGRRGRRGEPEPAPVPAPVLPPVAPKLTKREQALAEAERVEAERAALSTSKPIKKNKRALEEDIEERAVPSTEVLKEKEAEMDARTKRQRLRDEANGTISATTATATPTVAHTVNANGTTVLTAATTLSYKPSKEDARKFSQAGLFALERRLRDIMSEVLAFEVPDEPDAVNSKSSGGSGAGSGGSKSKSKKKKAATDTTVANTRRLAEDFESVPYDVIPEYDTLVSKVVTLDSMEESVGAHEYRSLQDFCDDFYVLLNNARSITTPDSIVSILFYCVLLDVLYVAHMRAYPSRGPVCFLTAPLLILITSQTWKDSAQLAELFEVAKARSVSDPFASKPRAPGNEVTAVKIGNGSAGSGSSSNGSAPSSPRSPRAAASGGSVSASASSSGAADKGYVNKPVNGKLKWTCACCKNLVCDMLSRWL